MTPQTRNIEVGLGDPQALALPALREDLELLEAAPGLDGAPNWTIFDPIRNSYFRIGWEAFQCLSRWSVGRVDKLIQQVTEQTTFHPNSDDIKQLINFLHLHELTLESAGGGSAGYVAIARQRRAKALMGWLQGLLFLRIPLWRPKKFLAATSGAVELLAGYHARWVFALLGITALFLVSRQWDEFIHSFSYFFNPSGVAIYIAALALVKILHELGHAYALLRYTGRTPTIGLAILVLVMPILYTDASHSWRLKSRRQRLTVAGAGMAVELIIAIISTWLWCLLPDGALRSAAFVFATSSWIMSLAVNLNPLMRFDGYYLFSDYLGVENLMQRSAALARWQLRRILFATPEPMPDPPLAVRRRLLVVYGWLGWVYRFTVYIGIALLVYHLLFKVLGIALFLFEIYFLIARPVVAELQLWRRQRHMLWSSRRSKFTLAGGLIALLLLLIPWSTSVRLPAILQAGERATVFSPVAARVQQLHVRSGESVVVGQLLAQMEVPALATQTRTLLQERQELQLRINRRVASREDLEALQVLYGRREQVNSELRAIQKLKKTLEIRAPLTGVVRDFSAELHAGRWVDTAFPLMFIAALNSGEIVAWVPEQKVARIATQAEALFIADNPELESVATQILAIRQVNSPRLEANYLASEYGGAIAVTVNKKNQLEPVGAIYRVDFEPVQLKKPPTSVAVGIVKVRGLPQSFIARIYRAIASTLVREWGF